MSSAAPSVLLLGQNSAMAQALDYVDDFNDNSIAAAWSYDADGAGITTVEQNQRLEMSGTSTEDDLARLAIAYTVGQVFDYQVDFSGLLLPNDTDICSIQFDNSSGPRDSIIMSLWNTGTVYVYRAAKIVNGTFTTVADSATTTDVSGKLRVKGAASGVVDYMYMAQGSSVWTTLASTDLSAMDVSLHLRLVCYKAASGSTTRVYWDNLIRNAG